MNTEDRVDNGLNSLYPTSPDQEWPRGDNEVQKVISLLTKAFQDLNQLDKDLLVRATHSPETLAELIGLLLPKKTNTLVTVLSRLCKLYKLILIHSSRSLFNQLFGGWYPAILLGERLVAFGKQSVYIYKLAAAIVLIEGAFIQRLGPIVGFTRTPPLCGSIFTLGGSLSNVAAMLGVRDQAHCAWRDEGMIALLDSNG